MSIRIGANPIGWTNDDLQEIGGDTPLETCLAEATQAGGAQGKARRVWHDLRWRLVFGRIA
jgi:hypothetical protein